MRIKHIMWTIILNIFLLMAVSIMLEYNSLDERFASLENTVSTAMESAVDSAMASEELFTAEYHENNVMSRSRKLNNSNKDAQAQTGVRLYVDTTGRGDGSGKWLGCSAYLLSMYYDKEKSTDSSGKTSSLSWFPQTEKDYTNFVSDSLSGKKYSQEAVYEWLFGKIGQDYTSSKLKWSSTNRNTVKQIQSWGMTFSNNTRKPVEDFESFYNNIGCNIRTKSNLKHKVSNGNDFERPSASGGTTKDTFEIKYYDEGEGFPVLAQMGLNLDGINNTASQWMSDNFIMTRHVGKNWADGVVKGYAYSGSGRNTESVYYLTPYSLGVTYVPVKVAKPVFMAHLMELARWSKLKSDNLQNVNFNKSEVNNANGCIQSDVWDYSGDWNSSGDSSFAETNAEFESTKGAGHHIKHVEDDSEIINDGFVEYDMSSIQMKVDYVKVNFYDKNNWRIVNKVLGSTSSYTENENITKPDRFSSVSENVTNLPERLQTTDTSKKYHGISDKFDGGDRLVAKVTVRMKVYIPYKNPLMQWVRYMEGKYVGSEKNNHMGIRPLKAKGVATSDYIPTFENGATAGLGNLTYDGTWFTYSTYRAISR